jgi:protein-L-isoaspartate O-methyltransferase
MVIGDGRLGYPQLAPYDAIHVGAGKCINYSPSKYYDSC